MNTNTFTYSWKDLHFEYGHIIYQAEIEGSLPRTEISKKADQLIAESAGTAFAPHIVAALMDIYDDITDNPELWESYGSIINLPESVLALVKA